MNLKMDDLKGMNPDKLKNFQFMNKKGQPLMLVFLFLFYILITKISLV
jgi:hypothetical protein